MNLAGPVRRAVSMAGLGVALAGPLVVSACDDSRSSTETPESTESPLPGPASTAGSASEAQAIVEAANAVSFSSSVDGRGDLLTVWSSGYDYERPTALGIRGRNGQQVLKLGAPRTRIVAALPDGWLTRSDDGLARLGSDGTNSPVKATPGRSTEPRPGDVAFFGESIYRPATNTTYSIARLLDQVHGRGAFITSDGTLLTLVSRGDTVDVASRQHRSWNHTTVDSGSGVGAGDLAGDGKRAIAFTTYHTAPLGDGAEDPVHLVAVSTDAGEHWHTARSPHGLSVVLSMAVTRSGTGFVSLGAGRGCALLRIGPAREASCVNVPTIQVFAQHDRVYSTYFFRHRVPYRLLVSDDQGKTWRAVPVPGPS